MSAPYLPAFPSSARAIGGDFDNASKEWVFAPSATSPLGTGEKDILDLMVSFYGTTGIDDPELCDVRVALGSHGSQRRGFFALGREIANRDKQGGFRLGHGVMHQGGALPVDRTLADDDLVGHNDAMLVVTDVPRCLAEREIRMYYRDSMVIDDGVVSVADLNISWPELPWGPLPCGPNNLGRLRMRLLARLAEVQQAIKAGESEQMKTNDLEAP
jgi:hypothetical protein